MPFLYPDFSIKFLPFFFFAASVVFFTASVISGLEIIQKDFAVGGIPLSLQSLIFRLFSVIFFLQWNQNS